MTAGRSPDRRVSQEPYEGPDKRRASYEERQLAWRQKRDMILTAVGITGLSVLTAAAMFLDVKNETLALGLLGVFGTLLGLPLTLRADERGGQR